MITCSCTCVCWPRRGAFFTEQEQHLLRKLSTSFTSLYDTVVSMTTEGTVLRDTPRDRVAYVLSVPMFVGNYRFPMSTMGAMVWGQHWLWHESCQQAVTAGIQFLLDLGVCVNASWSMYPQETRAWEWCSRWRHCGRLQHPNSLLYGMSRKLSSTRLLLQAGAYPACIMTPDQRLARRQWCAWHGRRPRQSWLSLSLVVHAPKAK